MNVLVWVGNDGPALVATLPADPAADPQLYALPGAAAAQRELAEKGPATSWWDWAALLMARSGGRGVWAVRTVPDASAQVFGQLDMHQALVWLRDNSGLLSLP